MAARPFVAALAFVFLSLTPIHEAHADDSEIWRMIGKRLGGEEGQQAREGIGAASGAACDVNMALQAIADGKDELVAKFMQNAANGFNTAVGKLETAVASGAFRIKLSGTARRLTGAANLFAVNPVYEEDILKRIAELAKATKEAAGRIADGNGTEGDLMTVVQNSSDITRLIAVFYEAIVVT